MLMFNRFKKNFNLEFINKFYFAVRSSCYGDVSTPLSYFTNPSYPTTDNMPNYCTYTIKVNSGSSLDSSFYPFQYLHNIVRNKSL
jgi:hypothetical protein